MDNEITNSQEDLNNEMKIRERIEYYEDKLLELKMQRFLDNYYIENELSKYKNKLIELKAEKDSLLKEKEKISAKISEIKEEKTNYEDIIQDLDKKIADAENTKKKFQSEINAQQTYLQNMAEEDNLVNFIIKNFSDEFKKEIYEICTKKVHEALKKNNNSDLKNNKEEKHSDYNESKNDSKFTMVSGQRGQFIPYTQKMPIPMPATGMPNMQKMNPIYFNAYNNNGVMMYPMFMPFPQNMPPGYQTPYFFAPMPVNPNMQQNMENNSDNNKNNN